MCDIYQIYSRRRQGQTAEIDEVDYRRHTLAVRGNRYLIIVRYSTRESRARGNFLRIVNPTCPAPTFLYAPEGLRGELVHEVKRKVKDMCCVYVRCLVFT